MCVGVAAWPLRIIKNKSLTFLSVIAGPTLVQFPVTALRIGSWTRFPSFNGTWDLLCYAQDRQLSWQIQDGGHRFKIQVSFDAISQLILTSQIQDDLTVADQLQIHLVSPNEAAFSMWRAGIDHDWVRCGDFSENNQASSQSLHILQGSHDSLRTALLQVFNQAPDLFAKFSMPVTHSQDGVPSLDAREFTLSPSATPEPFSATTTVAPSLPVSSSSSSSPAWTIGACTGVSPVFVTDKQTLEPWARSTVGYQLDHRDNWLNPVAYNHPASVSLAHNSLELL